MPTDITIYHNPACGTSRNTLAMIRAAGIEPQIVEYVKTPPSRALLAELIARAGMTPRDAAAQEGPLYAELGLDDPSADDDALLDAMIAHPILINRPLVVSPRGVKLCRPSEEVLDLLPPGERAAFTKEDGESRARAVRGVAASPKSAARRGDSFLDAHHCTLALTEALPLMVKVQVLVLLPPLEQAPDQMASRPLVTLKVIERVAGEAGRLRAADRDVDAGRARRDPLAAAAGGGHRQRHGGARWIDRQRRASASRRRGRRRWWPRSTVAGARGRDA